MKSFILESHERFLQVQTMNENAQKRYILNNYGYIRLAPHEIPQK
jgi:hypothetical protein